MGDRRRAVAGQLTNHHRCFRKISKNRQYRRLRLSLTERSAQPFPLEHRGMACFFRLICENCGIIIRKSPIGKTGERKGETMRRFWLGVMWFSVVWVLYGIGAAGHHLWTEHRMDGQALILALGMAIMAWRAWDEYRGNGWTRKKEDGRRL